MFRYIAYVINFLILSWCVFPAYSGTATHRSVSPAIQKGYAAKKPTENLKKMTSKSSKAESTQATKKEPVSSPAAPSTWGHRLAGILGGLALGAWLGSMGFSGAGLGIGILLALLCFVVLWHKRSSKNE